MVLNEVYQMDARSIGYITAWYCVAAWQQKDKYAYLTQRHSLRALEDGNIEESRLGPNLDSSPWSDPPARNPRPGLLPTLGPTLGQRPQSGWGLNPLLSLVTEWREQWYV